MIDHVVVFNERHLRRMLTDHVACYHDDRAHLAIAKTTPARRPVARRPEGGVLVAPPRVGGLHQRHEWRAAA